MKRPDRTCPWCHKRVPRRTYKRHVRDHAAAQLKQLNLNTLPKRS